MKLKLKLRSALYRPPLCGDGRGSPSGPERPPAAGGGSVNLLAAAMLVVDSLPEATPLLAMAVEVRPRTRIAERPGNSNV